MSRPSLEELDPGIGARAVRLYAELGSMDKVAVELRCGHSSVRRILHAQGIDTTHGITRRHNTTSHVACAHCGRRREVNMSRGYSAYCVTCKPICDPSPVKVKCGTEEGVLRHREFEHPLCKPCDAVAATMTPPSRPLAPLPVFDQWTGTEPVVTWRKGPGGIYHGIVLVDAEPEAQVAA